MEQKNNVEKRDTPKRQVRLDENDHHLIVGAVASSSYSKEEDSDPATETPQRKKRPRIKRKLDY